MSTELLEGISDSFHYKLCQVHNLNPKSLYFSLYCNLFVKMLA